MTLYCSDQRHDQLGIEQLREEMQQMQERMRQMEAKCKCNVISDDNDVHL